MIKFFVHTFCVEVLYSSNEDFVSHPFKLAIYKEMLTRAKIPFETHIIQFVDDIARINFRCFDRKIILGVFILSWSVKSCKLLRTEFTFKSNSKSWGVVFFGNMMIRMTLGKSEKIGTLGTIQGSIWASLLVPYNTDFGSLGGTILTSFQVNEGISKEGVWQKIPQWT